MSELQNYFAAEQSRANIQATEAATQAQTLQNQFNQQTMQPRVRQEHIKLEEAEMLLDQMKADQSVKNIMNDLGLMEATAMKNYIDKNGGIEYFAGTIAAAKQAEKAKLSGDQVQKKYGMIHGGMSAVSEALSASDIPAANAIWNQMRNDYKSVYGVDLVDEMSQKTGIPAEQLQQVTLESQGVIDGFVNITRGASEWGQKKYEEELKAATDIREKEIGAAADVSVASINSGGKSTKPRSPSKSDFLNVATVASPLLEAQGVKYDEMPDDHRKPFENDVAQAVETMIANRQTDNRSNAAKHVVDQMLNAGALQKFSGWATNDRWEYDTNAGKRVINQILQRNAAEVSEGTPAPTSSSGGNEVIDFSQLGPK
jgi:hypothetical protein